MYRSVRRAVTIRLTRFTSMDFSWLKLHQGMHHHSSKAPPKSLILCRLRKSIDLFEFQRSDHSFVHERYKKIADPQAMLYYFLANERTKITMFQMPSGFMRSPSPVIWPLPSLMM